MRTIERFDAMGTWIEVRADRPAGHGAVRADFELAETCFSRFSTTSELSRMNAVAAGRVKLSRLLAAVLTTAAELAQRTNGLVDPAVGGRVIDWGYDRTFSDLGEVAAVQDGGRRTVDWSVADDVIERPPGTRFDLGGIAKGWTADRAVQAGHAAVVSAGGDMASNDPATTVAVHDPWGEVAAHLHLGVGGLATSSISRRRWTAAGDAAHHLIDPRTGNPAVTPILSATVVASTAAEAEAGAKAVLILGESGLSWAARQPWIRSALAVWYDGNVFATPGVELAA
jgi:thiamine biosynthesis lipoprotein